MYFVISYVSKLLGHNPKLAKRHLTIFHKLRYSVLGNHDIYKTYY